ncbi:hypothetical protein DSCA_35770 [Desulfosarcina alkanivorans]|uniref:Uncharacterized protein n=1 Tax=Desulfosarcina alkanivorans TaxID=571177 RepID=A0A5K7YYG2_9BACT|nr:hypothetical protein [Desulfosarcina alkanivorans]BBO69647.1 hypothetical protein DSCA_35770 [Desulfosarcina alkanivorans]
MNKRRIEKLKDLLEELVPDQIDFQLYTEMLEARWDTDTFFRGKVLALHSYLKLLKRADLSASLNDFLPIDGNAIEALTFIRDHITPEILDYLEKEANVDENDLSEHFWCFLHPRIVTIAKPRFDTGFVRVHGIFPYESNPGKVRHYITKVGSNTFHEKWERGLFI